jgi:hypothetical protein
MFRRGESAIFENVQAVVARTPLRPFQSRQQTHEVFDEVLGKIGRFA